MSSQGAESLIGLLIYVGVPTLILGVGWIVGRLSERRHEKSLCARELALASIEVTTIRQPEDFKKSSGGCQFVCGEAVVASDAFKTWGFGLKNVVGGESRAFTRLFDRARREALVRMKQQALELGFNAICNVRYDSADVGGNAGTKKNGSSNMAISIVSGTAWHHAAS